MRVQDLGTLLIDVDGDHLSPGGGKPAAILALLTINANQRVSVGPLMEALWGDKVSARTASTLESHVWRLRRVLEPGRAAREAPSTLINDTGGYRLLVTPEQVDSLRFEQLAGEIRDLLAAGEPARALRRSEEALTLWRGRPYGVHADDEWAAAAVARLEEMRAQVQEHHIDALLAVGQPERALTELEALLSQMPFRERLWGHRMIALVQCGRIEEALQTYRRARSVLQDEIGIEPGPELRELHARILAQDPSLSGPARAETRVARPARPVEVQLPGRVTPLIGRAVELARLTALITVNQLVTIAGAAGSGKTRLAIEVARTAAGQFTDGVWFVDLNEVDQPELVVDVVISTIGIAPPAVGTALEALRAYTHDRRMLLVFDNCEHLLAGVAVVAETLLDADSECSVLATSREPIGVDGEVIWSLGPLPLPHPSDPSISDTTESTSPAVELFLARIRAADPTLVLDDGARQTVETICIGVDGLPLALELAAARIRSYTLAEIAHQVLADPSALTRIGHGPSDHRQTLRSAIEWSHRLLSEPEQIVHRRLSVLPGDFTRMTAVAVAGSDPIQGEDVPEVLSMLVHRSMLTSVRSNRPGGPSMFSQLATVRGHARIALAEARENDETEQRRDERVWTLMAGRPRTSQADSAGWYQSLDDCYVTIRATLRRTLTERPDPSAVWLLGRMSLYWYYRIRMVEGQRWLTLAASATTGAPAAASVLARLSHAGLLVMRGRSDLARPIVDDVIALLDQVPADQVIDVAESMSAVALAATAHESADLLGVLTGRVTAFAQSTGDPDLAILADGLECLLAARAIDPSESAARATGIYDDAMARGNLLGAWMACGVQTTVCLMVRDPAQGMVWSERTISVHASLGAKEGSFFLETRANFTALADRPRAAVRLYAASRLQTRRAGMNWPRHTVSADLLEELRARLPRAEFDVCWQEGERLTTAEALGQLAD
ncbi:MAG: hypothetical protein JWM76_1453 [Pseudonocardiales bacterium]|nr:hypothetical protein [Pseudonocardiales bacterium]